MKKIQPKFKLGDRVSFKFTNIAIGTIVNIISSAYALNQEPFVTKSEIETWAKLSGLSVKEIMEQYQYYIEFDKPMFKGGKNKHIAEEDREILKIIGVKTFESDLEKLEI